MASKTVTFSATSISPTNRDIKNGATVTVNFAKSSGMRPTTGAVLKSISMTFGRINVYSTHSPYLSCSYGNFYLGSSGSQSGSLTSAKSSILRFTGGTIYFTVCSGSSSTANVCNMKSESATLTVEWEARTASTGSLSSSTGMQGGSIYLDISTVDSSFTHTVVWTRDSSHSTSQNIAAGATRTTLSVPTSWPVGAATCTLYTYLNGSQVGSAQTYNWTVVVDGSKTFPVAGTLSTQLVQDVRVPSNWNVYVQGYSKAKLTLSGHSAGTSATIKEILLSLGSQLQSGTDATFTTAALTQSGKLTPSAKVTNSFGNSSQTTGSDITVYEYSSPKIASIIAYRCKADGVANDYGAYIAVSATATYSSVNQNNDLVTFDVQYSEHGKNVWSEGIPMENETRIIIDANLASEKQYDVRITAIDEIQNLSNTSTTKTSVVMTSDCVVFFKDGGLNVSIGTQGTRDQAIEINENWKIYRGDEELGGTIPISRGGTGSTNVAGARDALGLGNTSGAVPIANGGTGQTTVAAARNALGLGNTSGAVPVANGGTGATDAANARSNLDITPANIGAAASSHNHSAANITSGTLAAARLPFKVKYGTVTLSGASWSSVSLSGFRSTPMILVSYTDDATSRGLSPLKTRNRSSSSFEVCMSGSGSGSRTICYLAIGK